MRVRKAVFPAAGLGTRFLPATKSMPKEMLPVVDKPLIQFAVEEAIASDIEDVIIVTGRGKRAIEDYFDRSFELEAVLEARGQERELATVRRIADLCRFAYVRQKQILGLGHAVLCTRSLVGEEPFAVFLADDLVLADVPPIQQLLHVFRTTGHPVLAVQRVPRDRVGAYGVIAPRRSDGRVHEVADLVEKPRPGHEPSDLAIVGRYILTPRIFPVLARTPPGARGEIQLTDALRELARENALMAVEIEGRRFDAGTRLGLVQATVQLALEREDLGPRLAEWLASLDLDRGGRGGS
ncbi:MAG: UTP--glucose-1-phosphate uridylyltransferase [Acidobacteria bacterium]|nr:MAG: UTP--glucose-1-phosphate uridylyltransferase [Acidobacteriota bacterium]